MRAPSAIVGLSLLCALSVAGQQNPGRVQLDETGIVSPRWQNPKAPVGLGTSYGLDFFNATSNRTFVVSIPFEMRDDEAKSRYSLALVQRNNRSVADYTCGTLELTTGADCTDEQKRQLVRLEDLQMFKEKVVAGDFAKADGLSELNEVQPGDTLDMSHIEALYWTSACYLVGDDKARLGVGDDAPPPLMKELNAQAEALIARYIPEGAGNRRGCDKNAALGVRSDVLAKFGTPGGAAAKATFDASRKKIVLDALKVAVVKAIGEQYAHDELADVLETLEKQRAHLQDLQDDKAQGTRTAARCYLHLVRTAATLTASYGPDSSAPHISPFTADDPETICPSWQPGAALMAYTVNSTSADVRERYEALSFGSEGGLEITECTGTSCVARATVPPNGRAVFSRAILEHRSDKIVQFVVTFFDDNQPPANATGYAYLGEVPKDRPLDVPQTSSIGFGADGAVEYGLPSEKLQQHVRRAFGGGSLSVSFTGKVDVSATLQFKKGDFGGADTTLNVKASQYQAKIFGPRGSTLQIGKFDFAAPSSSIAIFESGEGFKFGWNFWSLGYLIRRESDREDRVADVDDDDSYALITQFTNPPLNLSGLRGFTFTAVVGNNEKDTVPDSVTVDTPASLPYRYGTFGADVMLAIPGFPNASFNLAAYHSVRNLNDDPRTTPPAFVTPLNDGEGSAVMGKFTLSRVISQNLREPLKQSKPAYSVTVTGAYGSGDDPETSDKDEGYIGETASFAQDKLFLSKLAPLAVILDEKTKVITSKVGAGLSNKYYLGVQYSEARWSPLVLATYPFGARKEVISMATIASLHKYWFVHELQGSENAGWEADVDFQIETPKNVRWTVGAAWYRGTDALKPYGIEKNPWSAQASVSIKMSGR